MLSLGVENVQNNVLKYVAYINNNKTTLLNILDKHKFI